jgi:hypothetical protein
MLIAQQIAGGIDERRSSQETTRTGLSMFDELITIFDRRDEAIHRILEAALRAAPGAYRKESAIAIVFMGDQVAPRVS